MTLTVCITIFISFLARNADRKCRKAAWEIGKYCGIYYEITFSIKCQFLRIMNLAINKNCNYILMLHPEYRRTESPKIIKDDSYDSGMDGMLPQSVSGTG